MRKMVFVLLEFRSLAGKGGGGGGNGLVTGVFSFLFWGRGVQVSLRAQLFKNISGQQGCVI